jgi:hypothetical protein
MFHSDTLFVIGAGAGDEVHMPLGTDLLSQVASLLDIRYESGIHQVSGSSNISQALRNYAHYNSNGQDRDINPYLHSAWNVRESAQLAKSIDDVLFRLSDDKKATLCGKLAIAECIFHSERNSWLYLQPPHKDPNEKLDYGRLRGTWFAALLDMLCQNISKTNLKNIFNNVSVISFNYDRCLKHFMRYGISSSYNIDIGDAGELAKKLKIIYPYGGIAGLEFEDQMGLHFGAEVNADRLIEIAGRLRTYTEQAQDDNLVGLISHEVAKARKIVFLGFGYHPQNIEILRCSEFDRPKTVYGTALRVSDADITVVKAQINEAIKCKPQFDGHHFFFGDQTCRSLFSTFSRNLPA